MELLSSFASFDGKQLRYKHVSSSNQCDMTFSVYLPPKAVVGQQCPVLYWLSGLTCNDENFVHKAGAQRYAAELGIIIVCPDTSPRGDTIADDPEKAWDFGLGAGFYVNATQAPWSSHYRMYDYVTRELPQLIAKEFPVTARAAISGHSMGGHGALVCALREPQRFASASAFAPICHPMQSPWGEKAFSHYLGNDRKTWRNYDACELLKRSGATLPILIDQGLADQFLTEQLKLDQLQSVVAEIGAQSMIHIDVHEAYDHSYFFIASFIEKHLRFHARNLIQ